MYVGNSSELTHSPFHGGINCILRRQSDTGMCVALKRYFNGNYLCGNDTAQVGTKRMI